MKTTPIKSRRQRPPASAQSCHTGAAVQADNTPRRGPEQARCPVPFGLYAKPSRRRVYNWLHNIEPGTPKPKVEWAYVWQQDVEAEMLLMMTNEECEARYGQPA